MKPQAEVVMMRSQHATHPVTVRTQPKRQERNFQLGDSVRLALLGGVLIVLSLANVSGAQALGL